MRLTIGKAKQIQDKHKINLLSITELDQLTKDLNVFLDVCWTLLKDEVEQSRDEWESTLDGDAIEFLAEEVVKAVINFTPQSKRPILQKALNVTKKQQQELLNKLEDLSEEKMMQIIGAGSTSTDSKQQQD